MSRPRQFRVAKAHPARRARGLRGEHGDRQDRVTDSAIENRRNHIVEVGPTLLEVGLLLRAVEGLGCRPKAAGQIDTDNFVASPGGREEVAQQAPVIRHQVGFLGQLTLRPDERRFPVDVEQTGRNFPVAETDRMPVLLDQQHAIVLVKREDGHGPRVIDVLARDGGVAIVEQVPADIPDSPLENPLARVHRHLE